MEKGILPTSITGPHLYISKCQLLGGTGREGFGLRPSCEPCRTSSWLLCKVVYNITLIIGLINSASYNLIFFVYEICLQDLQQQNAAEIEYWCKASPSKSGPRNWVHSSWNFSTTTETIRETQLASGYKLSIFHKNTEDFPLHGTLMPLMAWYSLSLNRW